MTDKVKLKEVYKTDDLPDSAIIITDDTPKWKRSALLRAHTKGRYVIYTQIDGDSGEVVYVRGWHLVNRTGVYALLCSEVEGRKNNGKVCPECNADLSEGLTAESVATTRYTGNSEYEDYPTLEDNMSFSCPICGTVLTDSEEEADEFIRGD